MSARERGGRRGLGPFSGALLPGSNRRPFLTMAVRRCSWRSRQEPKALHTARSEDTAGSRINRHGSAPSVARWVPMDREWSTSKGVLHTKLEAYLAGTEIAGEWRRLEEQLDEASRLVPPRPLPPRRRAAPRACV